VFRTAEGQEISMHFLMYERLRNDSWSPQHAAALRRVRTILQQAHELTQRQGATLVVAFIPLSLRVYKDIVQCTDGSTCATWAVNDLPRRFEMAVTEISDRIPYVDLTPLFIDEARRGRLSYLPDDTHWSSEGHRVAAEAIAKSVRPFLRTRQP
jgi:lysophospholipase L1-like esterase